MHLRAFLATACETLKSMINAVLAPLAAELAQTRSNHPFLSGIAEGGRLRILKRCSEGSAIAKAKGIKLGCEPKLSEHQRQLARRRWKPARALDQTPGSWRPPTP
jgi:hypothetical protein